MKSNYIYYCTEYIPHFIKSSLLVPVVYQLGPSVLLVITGHEFSLLMVNETTDQDAFRYLSECIYDRQYKIMVGKSCEVYEYGTSGYTVLMTQPY